MAPEAQVFRVLSVDVREREGRGRKDGLVITAVY